MAFLLPEQFHFKHQYSMFLHDILAKIVIVGEENGDFFHSFKLHNEDDLKTLESIQQVDTYDTMVNMGYTEEMDWVLIKQTFVAVLSDFTQFVFTALDTSTKGRLSVSYCLLRKPFKDNLLILEWLLANPDEFLRKFKSPIYFDEILIEKIPSDKKINIIKTANERSEIPFLQPDFIYELRYDKTKPYGFENSWQMANHIITNRTQYKTEVMNLNFVFSSYEDKISQWQNLYFLLPSILMYAVNICWSLYKVIQPKTVLIDDNLLSRLALGYSLCSKESVQEFDENIIKDIPLLCQKCGREINITKQIEDSITQKGIYKCPKCHRNAFFNI